MRGQTIRPNQAPPATAPSVRGAARLDVAVAPAELP